MLTQEEQRLPRYILLALNVVAMFSSIFTIGFALHALTEWHFVSSFLGSNFFTMSLTLLLGVGILSFAAVPMGLYSLMIQHSSMLVLYMACVFAIGCASIIAGCLGFVLKLQLEAQEVRAWMVAGLLHEYGHPDAQDVTDAWDMLQHKMVCCGLETGGVNEWVGSDWFRLQPNFPKRHVPLSCCPTCATIHKKFCVSFFLDRDQNVNRGLSTGQRVCLDASPQCVAADDSYANAAACTGQKVAPKHWPLDAVVNARGCYEPLRETLFFYSSRSVAAGFLLGGLHFVSAALAFVLVHLSDPSALYNQMIRRLR